MEKNRKKLSSNQVWILQQIKEKGVLKINNSHSINKRVVDALIKTKLVDYNGAYDGLVFTELGKTFEL